MKVSHHGSADPGLPEVLERLRPRWRRSRWAPATRTAIRRPRPSPRYARPCPRLSDRSGRHVIVSSSSENRRPRPRQNRPLTRLDSPAVADLRSPLAVRPGRRRRQDRRLARAREAASGGRGRAGGARGVHDAADTEPEAVAADLAAMTFATGTRYILVDGVGDVEGGGARPAGARALPTSHRGDRADPRRSRGDRGREARERGRRGRGRGPHHDGSEAKKDLAHWVAARTRRRSGSPTRPSEAAAHAGGGGGRARAPAAAGARGRGAACPAGLQDRAHAGAGRAASPPVRHRPRGIRAGRRGGGRQRRRGPARRRAPARHGRGAGQAPLLGRRAAARGAPGGRADRGRRADERRHPGADREEPR